MDIIQAALLGLVEGLTEFLPVSSTGHLIVLGSFLNIPETSQNFAFSIIIQLASILAILLQYKSKINFSHFRLWSQVFIAFLFVAVIGFIFRHQIKTLFTTEIVAVMFIVGGIVFLWVERFYKKNPPKVHRLEKIGLKHSVLVGIGQVFSLIPGTSRTGSTIVFGMIAGLDRKTSTEFSFLLALPVMLSVTGYEVFSNFNKFNFDNLTVLLVGFVIAFLSAFIVLKLFLSFIQKFNLIPFAIYRIIIGIILLYLAFV